MTRLKANFSLWRVAVLTLAFLLPAFVNVSALPFQDSISYIKGGAVAVEKFGSLFEALPPAETAPSAENTNIENTSAPPTQSADNIHGMRSVTYSVYAYVTSAMAPRGFAIAGVQSAIIAFIVVLFLRSFAPSLSPREFIASAVLLGLFTTAPWYGSFAMPDILAAGAVLTMVLFFVYLNELGAFEKIVLVSVTAFAITAHPGNILLVFGLTAVGVAEKLARDIHGKQAILKPSYLWVIAPFAIGILALLAVSSLGFGKASVAPKRFPYALARSVTDGPAYWHLKEHCDTYQYTVCEVFDGEIPRGVGEFLWEETGLRYKATPEQFDKIREEEMIIVSRAAREYPFAQVRKAFINTFEQLYRVGIPAIGAGQKLVQNEEGVWYMTTPNHEAGKFLQSIETTQIIAIYLSLAVLAYLFLSRRAVSITQLRAIGFFAVALLGNAVICGVLSGPADRYQGRLIWVLPLMAAVLLAADKPWKKDDIDPKSGNQIRKKAA